MIKKRSNSYQSADSHANDGAAQKGQGVLGTTGLCPTKGPATIAPWVHSASERGVPLVDQPRQLNTTGLAQRGGRGLGS